MKKFIFKLLVAFLPIVVIAYPLDSFISHYSYYGPDSQILNDLYGGKAKCDIAIYGSSRASNINPNVIKDTLGKATYSFGIGGQNIWIQTLRHSEFIKYNGKPKLIIFSIDMRTLLQRTDTHLPNQFLPFALRNENISRYASSYKNYKESDYYIPLLRYTGQWKAFESTLHSMFNSNHKPGIKLINGYYGHDKQWGAQPVKLDKVRLDTYNRNFAPESIQLFERFLRSCAAENINVILVYTPEYVESVENISSRNGKFDIIRKLAAKHNITFLDYSKDELSYKKDLFYDAFHMNKRGAELFTSKLAAKLKTLQAIKVD